MKRSFLNHDRPLLTNMIQTDSVAHCLSVIKNGIYDGAEAFGIQLCEFPQNLRTDENYRKLFTATGQRPVYITNYRLKFNKGYDDQYCMEGLMQALDCGATLCDIMGDAFDPSPLELTHNEKAINQQMKLIDQVHEMGKEVLMSSHVHKFLPAQQVLEIALEHQKRGADIAKIVVSGNSQEEQLENLRITHLLKQELKIPFLFLSGGTHNKLHRMVGPMLGSCMYLCVYQHDEKSTKTQPLLRAAKQVRDHLDYLPDIL